MHAPDAGTPPRIQPKPVSVLFPIALCLRPAPVAVRDNCNVFGNSHGTTLLFLQYGRRKRILNHTRRQIHRRRLNDAAPYFCPRVSCGLRREIIWASVHNNRPPQDLRHTEPFGIHSAPSISAHAEQRRQIPGMRRVRATLWIEMAAHIGKCILLIACAAAMFVDMQCKDIGRTGFGLVGRPYSSASTRTPWRI